MQNPRLYISEIGDAGGGTAELLTEIGFMRMVLDGALKDANLWTRATGASSETKAAWTARAARIRELLQQLPPPANPRNPFDDIPGEPTPEEAAAAHRDRAAAEDARQAARASAKTAAAAAHGRIDPDDDFEDITMVDGHGPMTSQDVADLQAQFTADDDIEDLLA